MKNSGLEGLWHTYIMTYKVSKKRTENFHCECCDYTTSHLGHWKRHKTTLKHGILTNTYILSAKPDNKPVYTCKNCNKTYKHRQSLYAHKKRCVVNPQEENVQISPTTINTENMENLSNNDLLAIIHQMIPQIGEKTTNTMNTMNTTNINVQVFLDENCKEAMTIQNFAAHLTMTIEDFLARQTKGFPTGVSNILIKNLKPIPLLKRPIHCTDGSGATWMVHDETDGWKKDNGKVVMKKTGFGINRRFQDLWNANYPNWQYNETLQQQWIELVKCLNTDPTDKEIEATLQKLGPECKLTTSEIRTLMLQEGCK
jgi:hypothetical protein